VVRSGRPQSAAGLLQPRHTTRLSRRRSAVPQLPCKANFTARRPDTMVNSDNVVLLSVLARVEGGGGQLPVLVNGHSTRANRQICTAIGREKGRGLTVGGSPVKGIEAQ
jgi:hypothetical protein